MLHTLYICCYLASLGFLNAGIIHSWPATAIPSIRCENKLQGYNINQEIWRKQTQELGIDETSWFGSLASVGALVGTSLSWIVTRFLSARQGLILCSTGLVMGWALIFSAAQVRDSRPDIRLSSPKFSGQLPAFDISWTACVGAVMWSLKPTVSNLHHRNCWNGQQRHSYFYVQLQSNIWDTFDQCSWFINRVISSFTLKSSLKACSANIIENVLLISKS